MKCGHTASDLRAEGLLVVLLGDLHLGAARHVGCGCLLGGEAVGQDRDGVTSALFQ